MITSLKYWHIKVKEFIADAWVGPINDMTRTSDCYTFVRGIWSLGAIRNILLLLDPTQKHSIEQWCLEFVNSYDQKVMTKLVILENKPLPLYYDHKVIISISRNLVICGRTKHVGIDRYFKKKKLIDGQLFIPFVKSEQQLVDVLTKVLVTKFPTLLYARLV